MCLYLGEYVYKIVFLGLVVLLFCIIFVFSVVGLIFGYNFNGIDN